MSDEHLAATFREQAEACGRLGSPMYEQLIGALADDIAGGGSVRDVLRGHEDDPGPSALALRLVGGLHRLVLAGSAPELAPYYPTLGGTWRSDRAMPLVREAMCAHRDALVPSLERAPQTNEVGRSTALLGGLLHVAAETPLPVRLWEIGSSAGLNLRADRFRYDHPGGTWGPSGSPVRLGNAWEGALPPLDVSPTVTERRGSDLHPIDPTTDEGRLTISSYVWPDQLQRWERLRAAVDVARDVPATVEPADAVTAVRGIDLRSGSTSVLWHSVMWQYLDPEGQRAIGASIESLAERATPDARFAHLFMEPTRRTPDDEHEFLVVLRTWPGEHRILGVAAPHGVPVVWE